MTVDSERLQRRAHMAVFGAVLGGALAPLSAVPCMDCGGTARVYHHPRGYEADHQLDVEPLCRLCHRRRHPTPKREKRPSVAKLLRLPPALEARIAALAKREYRTFTAQVLVMLGRQLEVEEQRRDA